MPAPTSEDDLKRRARRRLIGAVALTLVAVIALPLMMEDEPPPAAKLEVRMPGGKSPDFVPIAPQPATPPVAAIAPETSAAPPTQTESAPEQAAPSTSVEIPPTKAEAEKPKPTVEQEAKKPAKPNPPLKDESKTTVEKNTAFVVQLGAFSDASKTRELKQQVDDLGMSSYTDKSGELTRLRVGPFTTRDAASAAAAKLEMAGMHGQVMSK